MSNNLSRTKNMKKIVFSFCCLLLMAFTNADLQAQTTVRGRVIDAQDKQAIIGASVLEIDKDNRTVSGATTDIDGNFALRVSNVKNRIRITYLGYNSVTEAINSRTVINFSIRSSSNQLSDVIITGNRALNTGTGLNIDERNSTISTTTVNAKDLEELSAQSIDQALQGRMPGVDIGTTSGDPGAGMSIRIRGTSSINGSTNPLIVLDGLPFETEVPSDFNFGTADEMGYAQLLNIAPTDIKDITVLKDAAATAVWGSRAANGVLVINTKRGVVGKPRITYNLKASVSRQPQNIPLLDGSQYSTLIPEAVSNTGGNPLDIQQNKEFSYDPYDPFYYHNYGQNTNWIDAITQTGYMQDHNVSMSGGGEKARYYASVGYNGTVGTTVGTDLKRINTKINLDYTVSDRISFRTDITYTNISNNGNYAGDLRGAAYNKMPNMAIYQYDEFGNQSPNYFSPFFNIQGVFFLDEKNKAKGTYNPVAFAKEARSVQKGNRILPHFQLKYDILPSLLVSTFDVQFDVNNNKLATFLPQVATGRNSNETVVNRASDSDGDVFEVTSKLNFSFTPRFKNPNNSLVGLLSINTNDKRYTGYNALTANTASSLLQDPANPSRTTNADLSLKANQGQSRSIGVLAQAQYGFADKYMFNAGIRLDGSSRFGPNNRYGLFPSLSARWRVSGEKFMEKIKFIDELSLRGSYGQSGNAPKNDYTYFNQYNPFDFTYLGMSGVFPSNMELSDLRWETVSGANLGLNLGMLKNKVTLIFDIYRNRTSDMFYDKLQIPSFTGFTRYSANVGTMDNQGWELLINTIPYKSKDLTVGFDFNFSRNVNIMREVSEYFPRENGVRVDQNGVYKSYLLEGNPFGSFYGFKYKGVYSTEDATIAKDANGQNIVGPNGQLVYMRFNYPRTDYTFKAGDAMYEDINFDGTIDEKDIVYLGNGIAKVSGGFGPRFTYKNLFTLSAFFSYKLNYDLINEASMRTTNMFSYDNQSTTVLQRWRNPGDVTNVPRALFRSGYNWLGSDRYVEDASHLRLRSLTARYNMPKALSRKFKMNTASIYFTAENLFTWTNYTGQDPDVSTRGSNDPFKVNTDKSLTPPTKNLLMGISIGL